MADIAKMRYPDHMDDIFDELNDLSPLQRHALKERYRFLMTEYRKRCAIYNFLFYTFRLTMTVGSLAVPALLSIQSTPGAPESMYWVTWAISLAVTTSNGIMTLFKLDKRFFMLNATAERLRSETWQFVQLSGRYSGHHGHPHRPTHANQFVHYCSQLEKINMKRVDDEFIKSGDDTHLPVQPGGSGHKPSSDTMVPSPPDPALQTPETKIPDSISLVEDYDDGWAKDAKEKSTFKEGVPIMVQMSAVQSPSDIRLTVLSDAPELSGKSPVGVGTTLRSGTLQQGSESTGRP